MQNIFKSLKNHLNGVIFLLVLFFLGGVYAGILPSDLTTANNGLDGGDFMAAILTGGIPHPTGYPTYLIFSHWLQLLPFGSAFYKGALASFIPALAATGLLSLIPLLKTGKNRPGIVGALLTGLTLGVADLFMSQAVIVEVYALNALFVACYLTFAWIAFNNQPDLRSKMQLLILSALCGLSLGNHITIILMLPVLLLGFYSLFKNGWPLKWLVSYVLLFLGGGLIYLYLPFLARSYPPINWGNPQTLDALFWLISGQLYKGFLFNLSLSQGWERIKALAAIFMSDFWIIGLLLGIIGAFRSKIQDKFDLTLIYTACVYSGFSFFYGSNDSLVYLIPVLIVFSVWIGFSIPHVWNEVAGKFPWGKIITILLLISLLIKLPVTRSIIDPRQETETAKFTENYLKSVPENAILLTSADADTLPVWYYHYGLHWRSDVKVITLGLLVYDWYRDNLKHQYPRLTIELPENGEYNQAWYQRLSALNNKNTVCRSWSVADGVDKVIFECY